MNCGINSVKIIANNEKIQNDEKNIYPEISMRAMSPKLHIFCKGPYHDFQIFKDQDKIHRALASASDLALNILGIYSDPLYSDCNVRVIFLTH